MSRYGIGTVTIDTNLNIASIGEENSDKLVVDLNKNFLEMILPDDRHLIYEMIEKITEKEPYSFCFRFMGDKGEENWVIALCYKKEISGNDYYQITMQDISELEEKISMEVTRAIGEKYYEPLTENMAYDLDFRIRAVLHDIAVEQVLKPYLRTVSFTDLLAACDDFAFSNCDRREQITEDIQNNILSRA